MAFCQIGTIRYYRLESFQGVHHAFITRRGGMSEDPWKSLNVGGTVGDAPDHVKENKRRLFLALGRSESSIFDVWQVHSDRVVYVEGPRGEHIPHIQADAMITNNREVTLFMRFADCVPILLWDPIENAVGIVHAGWKGTVMFLAKKTVEEMERRFRSKPENILAGIGPSIAPHHYEVQADVVAHVESAFGHQTQRILKKKIVGGDFRVEFDLWTANQIVLERAGVQNIEITRLCTVCFPEDWFSHRGESGKTGRFGVVIGLN
jgi:polyphenol oxidase